MRRKPVEKETAAILAARVALLYESLPLAFYAIMINAAILAAVQWPAVGSVKAATWFGLVLMVTLLRVWLYHAYRRSTSAVPSAHRWYDLFLLGVIFSGVSWGSAAYFLFPDHDLVRQLFIIFVVGSMAAGSVTILTASFKAFISFLVTAMIPMVARIFFLEVSLNIAMGSVVTILMAISAISGWRLNKQAKKGLQRHYQRDRAEATIEFQAYHDSLTGLPNRRLLVDRLGQEISRCRRHNYLAAVLFIDIDRFKTINDSLGHSAGDALLREVAERLKSKVRKEDTAARLGGDEFVIVLSALDLEDAPAARRTQRLAEKIRAILSQPYEVEGRVLHTTPSIGIALFPVDSADADEILKQADIAMYRAKQLGRNTIQFYSPDMQIEAKMRLEMENELRMALHRNEMELYFQSQVDFYGRIVGAEASLRWNHPEHGMVFPADFIAIAEDTDIIVSLGEWVLLSACEQFMHWKKAADAGQIQPLPSIAVNVSPRQFRQQDFFQSVQHVIEQTGVDPRCIELELTESTLIENFEEAAYKMERLSGLGVRLAIDDFGTGYSSLNYLTRLPLHRLKIDQSFIRNVVKDTSSATVVQTIINMAHNLGLDVTAEGVETEEELQFLREKGCLSYQGFYFCKPMGREAFLRHLQAEGELELQNASASIC